MDRSAIDKLCRPEAFDHPAGDLALRETHISWVILCGAYAYKIKRPVNFGFLDFSTLAQRRHFCDRELSLNRRFAPELYLAVVPVTADPAGPRISGDGEVIDYAVQMRRFDESRLLDAIAARDALDRSLVRSLGRELARLHDTLPIQHPEPGSDEPGSPEALRAAFEQNFDQVGSFPLEQEDRDRLQAVQRWTRERYARLLPLMRERVADGRVIDGHGDVHLGNIALVDGAVTLFDCIEFNPAFRIVDRVGEIALLAMDMEARGRPGESHQLLCDYLEYGGDFEALALFDLYRSYYAMVRAKVNLLRESADAPGLAAGASYLEMRRYLSLAHRYCRPAPRFLAITHGVSGSGKSTVADKLVAESGAVRIRSDVERKRLFGLDPEERCAEDDVAKLYSPETTRSTFERLDWLAMQILRAGFPVIVDATFLHRRVRHTFRDLADRLAVPFAILDCVADPGQLLARLGQRSRGGRDASDADVGVMEAQLRQLEPIEGAELRHRVAVDSGQAASALWTTLRSSLCDRDTGS
jgi:aminoglycoside phosphotransferase family enzyme/gluconate kinase